MPLRVEVLAAKRFLSLANAGADYLKCIELSHLPLSVLAEDVFRLFSARRDGISAATSGTPKETNLASGIIAGMRFLTQLPPSPIVVIRGFAKDFRPLDRWIVTFSTPEEARRGFEYVSGRSIATSAVSSALVPLSSLREYKNLNELVESPASCILYGGFPPGTAPDDLRFLFSALKLAPTANPINICADGKTALVEFVSREEAHRAYQLILASRNEFSFHQKFSPFYMRLIM